MAFDVEIITPERIALQTKADAVVIPAADGDLGVLAGHAPLLAQLQAGQIRVRRGDEVDLYAVSGGFAEVKYNRLSIFAETAEMAQEIDAERARQAAEHARAALKHPQKSADFVQAEAALRRALARLRVLEVSRRARASSSRPA